MGMILDIYYPGTTEIIKHVHKSKVVISQEQCGQILASASIIVHWSFHEAARNIALYIGEKLTANPATAAAKAGENGFEIMRLLNQKYDPIGVQTQAKMHNRITNLINIPGPAKTFKETEDRVTLLDRYIQEYEERLGSKPNAEIVTSTFTNLVDPCTKARFVERVVRKL